MISKAEGLNRNRIINKVKITGKAKREKKRMDRRRREKIYKIILLSCAALALLLILLIGGFVFWQGLPVLLKYGAVSMLAGLKWSPGSQLYGLWPMIVGSVYITLGALIIGVPLGVMTAIFLAEMAPRGFAAKVIRPTIELLAGIPSVVYGLFGMTTVVFLVRKLESSIPRYANDPLLSTGYGVIPGAVVLAIMILPTIINVSEDAIRAVAPDYKEASLALGATHWQTISRIIVPAASSGIGAAVVLGMGRAVGETMAVIMVAGNSPIVPGSIFSPLRSLTGNIALEMAYSSGEHTQALFFTGIVLFVMIMLINTLAIRIMKRGKKA